MYKFFLLLLIIVFSAATAFAGSIAGMVTAQGTGEALTGANVYVQGTSIGTATDSEGMYYFEVEEGTYNVVCSYVGYVNVVKEVTVGEDSAQLDFILSLNIMKTSDIIVEASRAKERETPVAFTDIGADEIAKRFTVQDVPHLFVNTPGVYVTSDGGSGLGDSKVTIRGFDEQRISVMINNIEVNDPESKKVYWSNWGALPSGSQSIQVQRGAGSTLYGAGAFGGSINVLTAEAPAVSSIKINATAGLYNTYKLGMDYNTGLFGGNKFSFLTRLNYMTGNGWRNNTFYKGASYYFGLSWFANEQHTVRLVLHGAPQYHAYAYYAENVKNFVKYGRDWSSHPYVKDNDPNLTSREEDGTSLLDMLYFGHLDKDDGGEVIGNGHISFDNNVYHKPQLELHHTWDVNGNSYLQSDAFFSMGRGYGENIDGYYYVDRDDKGLMTMATIEDAERYQYRAYSIHNQFGLVTTYNTKWMDHDLSFGAEGRYWWARHYGLIINTFGQDDIRYYVGNVGADFREGDVYYDYTGVKPNLSAFAHGLWKFGDFSIMTDVQYSTRIYNIKEDFPSSNNYADPDGDFVLAQTLEGGNNDGYINADTTYSLIDYDKTYSFISPKFGVNYNINDQFNAFANYSRVYNEPRVKYFFNYGQPNDDLDIESSDDFELGLGFTDQGFNFKLNLYQINFDNKSYRIQDPTMANEPGYDYKGRRYVTVGKAVYQGVEFAANSQITDQLDFGLAFTRMENAWGDDVSDEAKDDLGIDEGKIEPGTPQFLLSGVLNYVNGPLYISAAARHYKDYYILPDNGYMDLDYDANTETVTKRGDVLPAWSVVDLILGWQQKVGGVNLDASLHINNLFDESYWQSGSEYGILPGAERNIILNLGVSL